MELEARLLNCFARSLASDAIDRAIATMSETKDQLESPPGAARNTLSLATLSKEQLAGLTVPLDTLRKAQVSKLLDSLNMRTWASLESREVLAEFDGPMLANSSCFELERLGISKNIAQDLMRLLRRYRDSGVPLEIIARRRELPAKRKRRSLGRVRALSNGERPSERLSEIRVTEVRVRDWDGIEWHPDLVSREIEQDVCYGSRTCFSWARFCALMCGRQRTAAASDEGRAVGLKHKNSIAIPVSLAQESGNGNGEEEEER